MRTPLVLGNWKMHGDRRGVVSLVEGLLAGLGCMDGRPQVGVCPPFVYLHEVGERLGSTGTLELGAQDLSSETEGAYTGDISGPMLRDVGCRFVLVGHSERRMLHGETDALVAAKAQAAVAAGLQPVVCVGESLEQRNHGGTEGCITRQLGSVTGLPGAELVVAYEPIWAIGTGQTATPEQAQAVHELIRGQLPALVSEADQVRIIYGGSVKADNAGSLFSQPDIDGGLVGGASLVMDEFLQICGAAV